MKKNKGVRIVVTLPESVSASVDYLIEHATYVSRADVMRAAVRLLMSKEFPKYMTRKIETSYDESTEYEPAPKKKPSTTTFTPTKDEVKREVDVSRGEYICEQLAGSVESIEGSKVCKWTTYEYMNPNYVAKQEQILSLEHMTPDLLAHQYMPDYETVSKVV